jgi:hypothetical protein
LLNVLFLGIWQGYANLMLHMFQVPALVKEFGPIDYIDFSPVEPHYFAVTCSVRVSTQLPGFLYATFFSLSTDLCIISPASNAIVFQPWRVTSAVLTALFLKIQVFWDVKPWIVCQNIISLNDLLLMIACRHIHTHMHMYTCKCLRMHGYSGSRIYSK